MTRLPNDPSSAAFVTAGPAGDDFATVLAQRTDVRLSAMNPALHAGLTKGADWLLADLRPAPAAGWWWASVVEYGTGIVEFQRVPHPAPRVPDLLSRMGVLSAVFDVEPSTRFDFPPYDPPSTGTPVELSRSVYFIQPVGGGLIKIGVATNPDSRLLGLQTGCPVELRLIGVIAGAGQATETELHQRFASTRVRGEWFEPTAELLTLISERAS